MKLIIISPEAEDSRESALLTELFARGLTDYHLRKPTWGRSALAAFLRTVPPEFHPRIVLHSHHELAADFDLAGLHERDSEGRAGPLGPPRSPLDQPAPSAVPTDKGDRGLAPIRSRAVHDLATLRASFDRYERLLFSPVFPSISKPGYRPDARITHSELKAILDLPRRAEVIALGGVDSSRLPVCRDLGFDGVAVLGAIWQSADPLRAFQGLQQALFAHAT